MLIVAGIAAAAYLIYKNWEPIKSFFSNLWQGVKNITSTAWEGIKSGFLNYTPHGLIIKHWDSVSGWFSGLWGRVKGGCEHWLGRYQNSILRHRRVSDGWFIGGLTAKLKAVKDKILSIGDSVTSWFKDKLGIASPSKVFAGLGGHLSEGLAVGIEGQKGMVLASMDGIRRDLARPMLATATIGASAMMNAATAAPSPAFGDVGQASAQIASAGKSVSISSSDTFNITITGDFGQDQEARLRLLLEEHERAKMLDRERYLND